MRSMFESSLMLQETGQLMMPAEAIITQLYKHQMYALAWMVNRENAQETGVPGGILADDMGLGKTLTVLALVLTNFHDKRPLAKPDSSCTYSRASNLSNSVLRYMPSHLPSTKKATRLLKKGNSGSESQVGAKLHSGDNKRMVLTSAFEHLAPKRRKDNKQRVKSSKNSKIQKSVSAFDMLSSPEASDDNEEKDEFDSMCFATGSTLSERIFGSHSKSNISLLDKPEQHFYDGLSDDDEYQNMSEKERNERLRPKTENINKSEKNQFNLNLNLDGMPNDILESSEDEDFVSTTTRKKHNHRHRLSSDEEEQKLPELKNDAKSRISNELPDLENSIDSETCARGAKSKGKIQSHNLQNGAPGKLHQSRRSISTLGMLEIH